MEDKSHLSILINAIMVFDTDCQGRVVNGKSQESDISVA